MSSAIISGVGKLNTNGGESNLFYMNIISIPISSKTVRTRLLFFSNQEVNNINDLVDVLKFYKSYNQPLIVAGGDLAIPNGDMAVNRYAIVDLFLNGTNSVNITYRTSASAVDNRYKLFDIGIPEPEGWIYINFKL